MTIRFHRLKDQPQDRAAMSRRMFLMTTTMAGVTTSAMLGGGALAAGTLDAGQAGQLLQMVQDIYPHPGLLSIGHYQAIATSIANNAADDADATQMLNDGLARVEEQAQALFGTSYTKIEDPDAREGILRAFEGEGFFQSVRWTAYFAIYDNKDIWPLFGYEGSSVEHGGYIDRGFSDITFVPQGPSLEERLADVQS